MKTHEQIIKEMDIVISNAKRKLAAIQKRLSEIIQELKKCPPK